jgi:hypothetical protein
MAEPLEVVVKGGEKVVGYACSVCNLYHSPTIYAGNGPSVYEAARDAAVRCCDRRCEDCNDPLEKGWHYTVCKPCHGKRDAKREQERYEKATKVPETEYDGAVFDEGGNGSQEGYFESLEELREYFDGDDLPEWVWACTSRGFGKFDAGDVIDNELSDHHEDARDWLEAGATAALQTALDAWVETYAKAVVTWEADHSRVVVLTKETKADGETPAEESEDPAQEGTGDPGDAPG